MPLTRIHKIAFSRVLTDLIKADFVVEEKEMTFFENAISKKGFNITQAMLIEGKKMDYAKAISILKELNTEEKQEIIELLKGLSLADGVSVPLEAIQVFALERALLFNDIVYSVPQTDVQIPNLTVIYIENEDGTIISQEIEKNYRSICNYFTMCGFDFVHIPHIVNDFGLMNREYLHKVVKYLIPSVSQNKIDRICVDLCQLTTSRFCKELLYKRIGLSLDSHQPSLLIKINESIIVDQYSDDEAERTDYSNYLQIGLKNNEVLNQISSLLDSYHDMINNSIIVESRPRQNKFYYSGFHRSLFDMIAYGRELNEYKLVFDLTEAKALVYFETIDNSKDRIILRLNPQETTLFALIAKKSIEGKGLDWREQIPKQDKEKILKEYNSIYSRIGKGRQISNEYKDRTQTNHIKNKVRVVKELSNIQDFIPEYYKENTMVYYRIKADPNHISILL